MLLNINYFVPLLPKYMSTTSVVAIDDDEVPDDSSTNVNIVRNCHSSKVVCGAVFRQTSRKS